MFGSFFHLFIQQVFAEHLTCTRHRQGQEIRREKGLPSVAHTRVRQNRRLQSSVLSARMSAEEAVERETLL